MNLTIDNCTFVLVDNLNFCLFRILLRLPTLLWMEMKKRPEVFSLEPHQLLISVCWQCAFWLEETRTSAMWAHYTILIIKQQSYKSSIRDNHWLREFRIEVPIVDISQFTWTLLNWGDSSLGWKTSLWTYQIIRDLWSLPEVVYQKRQICLLFHVNIFTVFYVLKPPPIIESPYNIALLLFS